MGSGARDDLPARLSAWDTVPAFTLLRILFLSIKLTPATRWHSFHGCNKVVEGVGNPPWERVAEFSKWLQNSVVGYFWSLIFTINFKIIIFDYFYSELISLSTFFSKSGIISKFGTQSGGEPNFSHAFPSPFPASATAAVLWQLLTHAHLKHRSKVAVDGAFEHWTPVDSAFKHSASTAKCKRMFVEIMFNMETKTVKHDPLIRKAQHSRELQFNPSDCFNIY